MTTQCRLLCGQGRGALEGSQRGPRPRDRLERFEAAVAALAGSVR